MVGAVRRNQIREARKAAHGLHALFHRPSLAHNPDSFQRAHLGVSLYSISTGHAGKAFKNALP